jgi:hypothetical protein
MDISLQFDILAFRRHHNTYIRYTVQINNYVELIVLQSHVQH